MKKILIIFSICLLRSSISSCNENDNLDSYYQKLFLGEKKTTDYFGPLDSRSTFSDENGDLLLLDDQFENHYLNKQIQEDALALHDFWFKKVSAKSTCPDIALSANVDYIRYLYRLVTISYLFESVKINHKAAAQIGAGKNICSMNFDDVFGKCSPQSTDMKKFHERVYGKFINEISKINVQSFNKKELAGWFENFTHSTSLTLDPVQARLHDWCFSQKKNCRDLSIEDIKNALGIICNNDRDIMQSLCSEKDNLYGISYVDKVTDLIQTSNAFNLINHEGMGEECLRRYVKVFSPKEVRYEALNRQFSLINSHLVRTNSRYLQGELFLPGALKEFDMKGLSDFLVALKIPKAPVAVIKVKPAPKAKPVIIVAKAKPIEAPAPTPVQMEIPAPKAKISEFEKKILELEEKSLESLSINMGTFRDDFEFSKGMMSDLAEPIKKFQTKAALSDMKSYDRLGSYEAPVGLIFLKYLLDTENHQGLFNIVSILGDKFYVNNDIEKKDVPVLIELKNDASTENHWQIILMKKRP